MFDIISVVIGVAGAVLGIAGIFLFAGVSVLVAALVKKLPKGVRSVLSSAAMTVAAITLFRHFAVEFMDILILKSVLNASLHFGICGLYLILGSVVLACWVKALFIAAAASQVGAARAGGRKLCSDNSKKLSSPSCFMKVSAVMLQ